MEISCQATGCDKEAENLKTIGLHQVCEPCFERLYILLDEEYKKANLSMKYIERMKMNKHILTLIIALTLPLSLLGSSRSKVRELTATVQRIRDEHRAANLEIQRLKGEMSSLLQERDHLLADLQVVRQDFGNTKAVCELLEQQQKERGQAFDENIAHLIEVNRQLQEEATKLAETEKNLTEMMSLPEKILLDENFQGYIKEA